MMAEELTKEAEAFYTEALRLLDESAIPFMVGGAYAMREYADIYRDTKDLDVFCTAGDSIRILQLFADAGHQTEVTDASWLSKAFKGEHFVDLIFSSANGLCPVDASWFEHARSVELFGSTVKLIPPEEEIWTKVYVQQRHRFDGADVHHIIRKSGDALDWHRLLARMEPHWQLLLTVLINFRFVYPSERHIVPGWLLDDLLTRARHELDLPEPKDRICRGPILSRHDYDIDVAQWGYEEK